MAGRELRRLQDNDTRYTTLETNNSDSSNTTSQLNKRKDDEDCKKYFQNITVVAMEMFPKIFYQFICSPERIKLRRLTNYMQILVFDNFCMLISCVVLIGQLQQKAKMIGVFSRKFINYIREVIMNSFVRSILCPTAQIKFMLRSRIMLKWKSNISFHKLFKKLRTVRQSIYTWNTANL